MVRNEVVYTVPSKEFGCVEQTTTICRAYTLTRAGAEKLLNARRKMAGKDKTATVISVTPYTIS